MRRALFFRRRESAQTPGIRRTRITSRCLRVDLHEELPAAEVDIGTIDHPIMRMARELTPSYPANLARIPDLGDTQVFRFTHGRARVATCLDGSTGIVWVCAVDERDEETSDHVGGLHAADQLLPGEDDALRERVEVAARFVVAIREGVPRSLDEARAYPKRDTMRTLPGGQTLRFCLRPGDEEEFWIAMPTLGAPGGLTPPMRAAVVAAAQERLGDAEWEQRFDWLTGDLPDHEIAVLRVR